MRHRLPILGAAAVYVVALLLIGLWPTHVDQNLDMVNRPPTSWIIDIFDLTPMQGYTIGEFVANVLLFVPLGALALGLLPRLRWTHAMLAGGLFSVAIEMAQMLARPGRTAGLSDVVANTLGAAIGAYAASLWLQRSRQRSERTAERRTR